MGTRFKEHTSRKGTNSAIKEHLEAQGHTCTLDEVKVLEKEDDWFKRKVKEAILIHRHQPTLNRDNIFIQESDALNLLTADNATIFYLCLF